MAAIIFCRLLFYSITVSNVIIFSILFLEKLNKFIFYNYKMQLSPIISVYESDTSLLFPSFILVKGFHCWGQHCVEVRAEALA